MSNTSARQSRDGPVLNVREGRAPAQVEEELGARGPTRQQGNGDLQEGKGEDAQALGSGMPGPVAEPGDEVPEGDSGLGSPGEKGGWDGKGQTLDHAGSGFVPVRQPDWVVRVAEGPGGKQEAGL